MMWGGCYLKKCVFAQKVVVCHRRMEYITSYITKMCVFCQSQNRHNLKSVWPLSVFDFLLRSAQLDAFR